MRQLSQIDTTYSKREKVKMGKPIRKDGSYDSLHGKDSIYLLFADSLVEVYIFVKSIEKKVIVFINLQNYKYFAFLIDIIDNNRGKAMY